jgi:hypothetical protein
MKTLKYKVQFLVLRLRMHLKVLFLKLGCHFICSWHFIKSGCICTTGQVVKLNHIYTYEDNEQIDLVRLTDIHFEREDIYTAAYFSFQRMR